jgi:hypothetical protein
MHISNSIPDMIPYMEGLAVCFDTFSWNGHVLKELTVPPKFPVPVKLAFLLRLGSFPSLVKDIIGERECENAKQMVTTTLKVILILSSYS